MPTITHGVTVEKWPQPGAIVRFFGLTRSRTHGHEETEKKKTPNGSTPTGYWRDSALSGRRYMWSGWNRSFQARGTLWTGGTQSFQPPGTLGTGGTQIFQTPTGTLWTGRTQSFHPPGTLRTGGTQSFRPPGNLGTGRHGRTCLSRYLVYICCGCEQLFSV